jgi:hypothetical protein
MRSSVVDRVNNYRHHHHYYDVIRSTKITLHYYHPPADWLSLIDKKKELYDKLMTFFIIINIVGTTKKLLAIQYIRGTTKKLAILLLSSLVVATDLLSSLFLVY